MCNVETGVAATYQLGGAGKTTLQMVLCEGGKIRAAGVKISPQPPIVWTEYACTVCCFIVAEAAGYGSSAGRNIMRIDSILRNAVNGVEKGLDEARQKSAQLAIGAPKPDDDTDSPSSARVEKAADAELGKIVDTEA
jgi:hypothetical protein